MLLFADCLEQQHSPIHMNIDEMGLPVGRALLASLDLKRAPFGDGRRQSLFQFLPQKNVSISAQTREWVPANFVPDGTRVAPAVTAVSPCSF